MTWRARIAELSPRAILVAGWSAFALYAYPGYMSWDAMTQLAQARRGVYTDDHPPAMAALWRVFEIVVTGPLPMMLVCSVLFLLATRRLLGDRLSPRAAAIAAVVLLWFPPIGTVTAAVYKDSVMATFVMVGAALLVTEHRRSGLFALGVGTAMRYNAIFATLPIVVLLYRPGVLVGWRRYAAAVGVYVAISCAAFAVDVTLADTHRYYWYRTQALMDIADTLANARDYSDDEIRSELSGVRLAIDDHIQARLREIYKPVDFRHLDRGDQQVFMAPETAEERAAVARAWKRVLEDNPGAYLRYRWDNFVMLMRLDHHVYDNAPITMALRWHEDQPVVQHDVEAGRIQRVLLEGMRLASRTPLFYPYPYALLALLLLPLARGDRLSLALLFSGLCYQAAWLPLAPTADYRYSQWMVATTAIAAVRLVAARRRSRTGS
ncbi:MAG TPA: hypothetical protein VMJ10_26550 [Kofleriaceae bacterium]|nr:hypothetical protein [Kofleriaceae bacterium]